MGTITKILQMSFLNVATHQPDQQISMVEGDFQPPGRVIREEVLVDNSAQTA